MTGIGHEAEIDQSEVIGFLCEPGAYPLDPPRVDRIETHGAIVFLAGEEAWKMKRAVRFSYMDFSTLEKRRAVCQREVEINRRWAPELYLGCTPVTREPSGRLALGGEGAPVEWLVHMRRFGQEALLGCIAERQGITADLAHQLADLAFDSHAKAERIADPRGAARVGRVLAGVSRNMGELTSALPREQAVAFAERANELLTGAAEVLDVRARRGFVRRCHGDLHLGNIVLWEGRPRLFDAIEFDEEIASVDTLYDLAFLLMDLDHRRLRDAANAALNRYLWRANELLALDGLAALPLFLALRAGVRAMVAAERAGQEREAGEATTGSLNVDRARSYLSAAVGYLGPPRPRLIAVAGLSGTGKSTLAARLAPGLGAAPGAVHLRSDLERKSLFGAEELQRLGPECYTESANARVYETMFTKARHCVSAGHAVIVDAVSARQEERDSLEALGESLGTPLEGVWLTAPPETLVARVSARRGDASDATAGVVARQLGYEVGALSGAWRVVDAGRDIEATTAGAKVALARR